MTSLLPLSQNLYPLGVSAARFSPDRVAGLTLWLKADAITGLADGDPVGLWPDSGGFGNDAAASGADRPAYRKGILAGKPVVRFGGSHRMRTAAFASRVPQPATVFLVASAAAGPTPQVYYDGLTAPYRQCLYKQDVSAPASLLQFSTSAQFVVSSAYAFGTVDVLASLYDGAASRTWRNGSLIGAGATGGADLDGLTLGDNFVGTAPLSGDVAEVLVYAAGLSDADRSAVEHYLLDKYGI